MKRELVVTLAAITVVGLLACRDASGPGAPVADLISDLSPLEYAWIPLDLRGSGFKSSARALNNHNQIVGFASTGADGSGPSHAFLWDNGMMLDLGTLGGPSSEATDINERGQIVGWSDTPADGVHAFFWENGSMEDLGPLAMNVALDLRVPFGFYQMSPVHVNEQGQVVGNRPGGGTFLWEGGATKELPLDIVSGINDLGEVVGAVRTADSDGVLRRRAALWTGASAELIDIGTLGGQESWAMAISNSGWVAATGQTEPRELMGGLTSLTLTFRWKAGSIDDPGRCAFNESACPALPLVSELGHVVATDFFTRWSIVWDGTAWQNVRASAYAMNDEGTITGLSGSFACGLGFVWKDGVTYSLGTGLTVSSRGRAINDLGIVAGNTGCLSSPSAAIWVPVPPGLPLTEPIG